MTNLEEITDLIANGNMVDQIYLDLSKAFDKVPHQRLLIKLRKAGISGRLLSWMESFLLHRLQHVKVNGTFSKMKNVTSGVPQGSVLGPILFLIFINDLPNILSTCSSTIFADDTKLSMKVNTDHDVATFQNDLDMLAEWCKTWRLQFNADKCHILHLGKKNFRNYYHLNGRLLTSVNEEKDLGVIISEDLAAEKNVGHCVKKANKVLGMIRRTFSYLNQSMVSQLYKVFVRPHLEYCQQACSPYLKKDQDKLEKVQRSATKLMQHMKDLPYEERLKELNLYSLEERRMRGDMILMYRLLSGDLDIDYRRFFTYVQPNTQTEKLRSYNRHSKIVKAYHSSTKDIDVRRNFFSQRAINPWNSLPESVVSSESIKAFKWKYDNWRGKIIV